MTTFIYTVGYAVLGTAVLAILYVFYKLLAGGLKAFLKNDD